MSTRTTARALHLSLVTFWLALPVCHGCGSDSKDESRGEPQDEVEVPTEYGTCPGDLPGHAEGRECATFEVPLRWEEPEGEQIELLVARYRVPGGASRQLWLLDGGPGGTGASFMDSAVVSFYLGLGADLYIPQHRGTGHSSPLACDTGGVSLVGAPTADLLADCGAELSDRWGESLRGFHSDQAGRDVGHLIAQSGGAEERVFVFGVSYGSYWAQRYLQHFPEQADGVILQGVLPLGQPVWEADAAADRGARSLLKACEEQPDCLLALGDAPEAVAARVVERASDPLTRCGGESGPDRRTLAYWFALMAGEANQFIPGLIRRLDRCSAADAAELSQFAAVISQITQGASAANPPLFNDVLGVHVLRSDVMSGAKTLPLASLTAARESLLFWSATSPERFALYAEHWPVSYAPAPTTLPDRLPPILIMSGEADLQSPSAWASALASDLGAQLVTFPRVGHGVDFSLLRAASADVGCSLAIERAFMDNPENTVDTECAASAYVPDFAGTEEASAAMSQQLYGSPFLLGSPAASL